MYTPEVYPGLREFLQITRVSMEGSNSCPKNPITQAKPKNPDPIYTLYSGY